MEILKKSHTVVLDPREGEYCWRKRATLQARVERVFLLQMLEQGYQTELLKKIDADERQAEPASGADRGSSGEPGRNPAGQPEREVSGTEQGERPAGMGSAPEQPDDDGRGDRLEGIGVQLTEPTTEQDLSEAEEEIASAFSFPDLPTVEQQIRAIEAPIRARYADEIALDPEVVDEILRTGSNRSKGQLRLIYNFMVEKTPEEYTEFVKNEYGTGGKGFEIDGSKYAGWFDDLGLRIAVGSTAKGGTIANAFLSWEDVSNRIHELLRQGEYAPQAVLDAARQNALQEHAQTLAYMERDLADGVAEAVFQNTEIFRGGFPELTDRLAGLLDDTDFLTDLNERLSALGEAYAEDGVMSNVRFDELELMLMAMFEQPTLRDTIQVLTEVQPLVVEDAEMAALVQQTIQKLQKLNEQQFKGLELEWHKPEESEKEKM